MRISTNSSARSSKESLTITIEGSSKGRYIGEAPLDKELIPLLREMNKAGLRTTQSCSGHGVRPAYVSIDMANIEDVAVREKGKKLVIWWKPEAKKQ